MMTSKSLEPTLPQAQGHALVSQNPAVGHKDDVVLPPHFGLAREATKHPAPISSQEGHEGLLLLLIADVT